jgi:hypothetical protein
MNDSMIRTRRLVAQFLTAAGAEPAMAELAGLLRQLEEVVVQALARFLGQLISPVTSCELERQLWDGSHEVLRQILSWTYNHIEPSLPESVPGRIEFTSDYPVTYRRRIKSPNGVGTLFGEITLQRWLYEPLEPGERCLFPLERALGVVARGATPALAERVAWLSTAHTQEEVLDLLRREFHVDWSVATLRKVVAAVRDDLKPHLHEAQVQQVLAWLQQATDSRGRHKPVLAVGRDGIFLPIRNEETYKEGAVGTVSVLDRRGRRIGTVYLGTMPEPGQGTLSNALTRLLRDVLGRWQGPMPRLAYVTDAGYHPMEYYRTVLCRMRDPRRPGRWLSWTWIVDFYHASEYVHDLAEVLFKDEGARRAWARRMCHCLKHKTRAVYRVLHSAAKLRADVTLTKENEKAYHKAYGYLRDHAVWMNYREYARLGLPLGSGVTEAACKTVFTQRFKASGMSWGLASGQVILDLRLTRLSGVWQKVYQSSLKARTVVSYATQSIFYKSQLQNAA